MIVVSITGSGFINTAEELTCILLDLTGERFAAFSILFLSSTEIICQFDMVDKGDYALGVSNNGAQFTYAADSLEVSDAIHILNIEPKIVRSNSLIYIEANNVFDGV